MTITNIPTSLFLGQLGTSAAFTQEACSPSCEVENSFVATDLSLLDQATLSLRAKRSNPVAIPGLLRPLRFTPGPRNDTLKSLTASAAFAATNLMASGAMAAGEEWTDADIAVWLILFGIPLGSIAIGGTIKWWLNRVNKKHANLAPSPSSTSSGPPFTIGGKTYSNFDAAYQAGNIKLERTYKQMRWSRNGYGISAPLMLVGGIHFGSTTGFLMSIVGTAACAIKAIWDESSISKNMGYFTRGYLEKKLNDASGFLQTTDYDVVTEKKIAKWVNCFYHMAARTASERYYGYMVNQKIIRTFMEDFRGVLIRGTRITDRGGSRVLDLFGSMGVDLILPFVDWATESVNGALMFKLLAQYNPAAAKLNEDPNLMKDKPVKWVMENLQHPEALEAMRWLVAHGNTDVIEFVIRWADGGNKLAISLWNRFQGGQVQPVIEGVRLRPGGRQSSGDTGIATAPSEPRNDTSDALLGQPQATQWLQEMRDSLMVDEARKKKGLAPKTLLHAAFTGPDGVGKVLVAAMYTDLLRESGRIDSKIILKVSSVDELTNEIIESRSDPIFLIQPGSAISDKSLLRSKTEALAKVWAKNPKRAFVLIGTAEEVQTFLKESHPDFAALIKHRVPFNELGGDMLAKIAEKMAAEEGYEWTPEAAEKIRRVLKDKKGGSAVAKGLIEKAVKKLTQRIARELDQPDFDAKKLTLLEATDFTDGRRPMETKALRKLEKRTGLTAVKKALREIEATLRENMEREEGGLATTKPSFHIVLTGKTGTGKTLSATSIAEALNELGFLRTGQFVRTTPAKLVGDVVGAAETRTLKKLDEARGGVLFVDEAHTFANSPFGETSFRTIIPYMEDHRDDMVVIFAGYPGSEGMEKTLNIDSGSRRRIIHIHIDDYTIEELGTILDEKVTENDYMMDAGARSAALDMLNRRRAAKDFGNAGEARKLFEEAVKRQSLRLREIRKTGTKISDEDSKRLTMADFEGQDAPNPQAALMELDKFVGLEKFKAEIQEFVDAVELAKKRGADPRERFTPNFLFAGPTGTGKTSAAGTLGKILKSLGLLPDDKVIKVNAVDLIAGFTGQTAGKTEEIFDSALGGVLLIDEIGGLVNHPNAFTGDSINKLLTLLIDYKGRLGVVVAGYDDDINAFLKLNDGFPRRFPNRATFERLTVNDAVILFRQMMQDVRPNYLLSDEANDALPDLMIALHVAPRWASGGDVENLIDEIVKKQARHYRLHPDMDTDHISLEVLRQAVESCIEKKSLDAELDNAPSPNEHRPHRHATAEHLPVIARSHVGTTKQSRVESGIASPPLADRNDTNIGIDVEAAATSLDLSPEEALQQMNSSDPNSALAIEVAQKMGITPEEAAKKLAKLAEQNASKPQELGWICMYCGNGNPECPYKGRKDREKFNALAKKR